MFAIIGQCVIQYSLYQQSTDALVLNTAGRQRYLSLRLTMVACALVLPVNSFSQAYRLDELKTNLTFFIRERHGLEYGDSALGLPGGNSPEVMQLLSSIEPNYEAITGSITSMINTIEANNSAGQKTTNEELMPFVKIILAQEEGFASIMNSTVLQYQHEAEGRNTRLRIIEIVLFLLTLSVLGLEGKFVFHPAVAKLQESMASLIKTEKKVAVQVEELEHKNTELELAFDEAMAAHRKVMPHARVVRVGFYQVMGSRGDYFDVESKSFNGAIILECRCPMYKRNLICSHSLAAGSLHSAMLRQQGQKIPLSPVDISMQKRFRKEG